MFEKFFPERVVAIKNHMKEEGMNLKEILQKSANNNP
jgi:hypothetical protein